MAVIDLDYDKHIVFETKVSKNRESFELVTSLRPEITKWLAQHSVRHQLIRQRNMQICILDHQKAMLFKLTWM